MHKESKTILEKKNPQSWYFQILLFVPKYLRQAILSVDGMNLGFDVKALFLKIMFISILTKDKKAA